MNIQQVHHRIKCQDGVELEAEASMFENVEGWLGIREMFVTGSKFASLVGLSPYPPSENIHPITRNMKVGNLLEPVVLDEFEEERKKLNLGFELQWNKRGYFFSREQLGVTPDAFIVNVQDQPIIAVQVKTTTQDWLGTPPPWVIAQAQLEAIVLGCSEYIVAWYQADMRHFATFHWIQGQVGEIRVGKHSWNIHDLIQEALEVHKTGIMPMSKTINKDFTLSEEAEAVACAYDDAKALRKRVADIEKLHKQRLERYCLRDGFYITDKITLRRRTTKARRVSTKKMAEEHPELVEKYKQESKSVFFDTSAGREL